MVATFCQRISPPTNEGRIQTVMRSIHLLSAVLFATAALSVAGCTQSSTDGLSGAAVPGRDVENPPVLATEVLPTSEVQPPAVTDGGVPLIPDGIVADADPKGEAKDQAGGNTFSGGSDSPDSLDALSPSNVAAYLAAHNRWRTNYGTPLADWDNAVAAYAQEWADHLAGMNAFEHRTNGQYGENIWMGTAGRYGPDQVVDSWGSEVRFWDVACSGGIQVCCQGGWQNCGHFTQVVWYASVRVGCGKATSAQGNDIVVCNYAPPGNFSGQDPFPPQTGGATNPTPTPAQATATPSGARVQPTPTRATQNSTSTWSRTWDSINLDIPDAADSVSFVMNVTQNGSLSDIGIGIKITHSYVGDLSVMLVHPDGTEVMLRNQTGGSSQNISAVYGLGGIPVSALATLKGKPIAGDWMIVVQDHAEEDIGTLDRVKLDLKYSGN